MKLIQDAEHLWHRLWSVRFGILASTMGSAAAVLSFIGERSDSLIFIVLASILSAASAVARLVDQPKLRSESARRTKE